MWSNKTAFVARFSFVPCVWVNALLFFPPLVCLLLQFKLDSALNDLYSKINKMAVFKFKFRLSIEIHMKFNWVKMVIDPTFQIKQKKKLDQTFASGNATLN